MTEKIDPRNSSLMLRFAAALHRSMTDIIRNVRRAAAKTCCTVGAVVICLIIFSARSDKYSITFDHNPFVLRIEPMDAVEQRVREEDQTKEAERLARKGNNSTPRAKE